MEHIGAHGRAGWPTRLRRLDSLIDGLIPPSVAEDENQRRKARLSLLFVLLSTLTLGTLSTICFVHGSFEVAATTALLSICFLGVPLLLRRLGMAAVGMVIASAWMIATVSATLMRGTIAAPETMVMGFTPVLATFFTGRRAGAFWLVADWVALLLVAYVLPAPTLTGLGGQEEVVLSPMAFAFLSYGVACAFEWTRSTAEAERERSEEARLAAQRESDLLRADRLVSMGRMASAVAHEINNPLSYIRGNVTFLLDELASDRPPSEEWRGALEETLDGVHRVQRIVGDLKVSSRMDDGYVSDVALKDVVERAIRIASHELKHVTVERIHEGRGVARIDPVRIGQVLVNLLVNAGQASPDGGVVRVHVRDLEDAVEVLVADAGMGIPVELHQRVFEPFFTTKPVGEGTGLGLSVSRNIVAAAGGGLHLASALGVGTELRVVLPRTVEEGTERERDSPRGAPPPASPLGPVSSNGPGMRRLLVIDDDRLVRRSLQRMLRHHDVTVCQDGGSALERITSGEQWDLALCDITMPTLTGPELYERLVEANCPLADRMVFITGGALTDTARDFVRQHADRVVFKPLDPNAILALVEAATGPTGPRISTRAIA